MTGVNNANSCRLKKSCSHTQHKINMITPTGRPKRKNWESSDEKQCLDSCWGNKEKIKVLSIWSWYLRFDETFHQDIGCRTNKRGKASNSSWISSSQEKSYHRMKSRIAIWINWCELYLFECHRTCFDWIWCSQSKNGNHLSLPQ